MPVGMPKLKPTPAQMAVIQRMVSEGLVKLGDSVPPTRDEATRLISEHMETLRELVQMRIDEAFERSFGKMKREWEREMWELSQDGWH